jgi:hypothetical protein
MTRFTASGAELLPRTGSETGGAGGVRLPPQGTSRPSRSRSSKPRPAKRDTAPGKGSRVTQTVAITGASAGIGRAVARLFAERGAQVGLVARGQAGLEGAVRDVERAGGVALAVPGGRGGLRSGRSRRQADRRDPGPDRRVGQRGVRLRVRPVRADHARGVPAGDRGHLPRVRARHHGGLGPDAAARPRRHRAGGLGARVAQHPVAGRLLRRQARDQRIHRVAALRAYARQVERPRHRGADAGGQHPPVLLGPIQAAQAPAAGAADIFT